MLKVALCGVAMALNLSCALAAPPLKTCSANQAYCDSAAKKNGWTQAQCGEAFARCMSTGEWQTTGPWGRTVRNVERR